MALFRDEKEALRRLEAALQAEESDDKAEYEEEYGACEEDFNAEFEEDEGPEVSRIRIRNTDRTDLDPLELTEQLQTGKKRRTAAAIIALLTIAAAFIGLIFLLQKM